MFLFLHVPRVIKNPQTETEWTSMCIALAMSGIGFILAINGKNRNDFFRARSIFYLLNSMKYRFN
jgi:hypothetical protein